MTVCGVRVEAKLPKNDIHSIVLNSYRRRVLIIHRDIGSTPVRLYGHIGVELVRELTKQIEDIFGRHVTLAALDCDTKAVIECVDAHGRTSRWANLHRCLRMARGSRGEFLAREPPPDLIDKGDTTGPL